MSSGGRAPSGPAGELQRSADLVAVAGRRGENKGRERKGGGERKEGREERKGRKLRIERSFQKSAPVYVYVGYFSPHLYLHRRRRLKTIGLVGGERIRFQGLPSRRPCVVRASINTYSA